MTAPPAPQTQDASLTFIFFTFYRYNGQFFIKLRHEVTNAFVKFVIEMIFDGELEFVSILEENVDPHRKVGWNIVIAEILAQKRKGFLLRSMKVAQARNGYRHRTDET